MISCRPFTHGCRSGLLTSALVQCLISNPVPMEIDAAKKKADIPDTCQRCGQTGHWARDCGKRFDIRFLFADEKEALLQNWAIDADTKELEERVEEPEAETPMDF
jgi:hypothetical protein